MQSRISKLKNELSDAESYARQANMSDPAERVFVEVFADYQRQLQKGQRLRTSTTSSARPSTCSERSRRSPTPTAAGSDTILVDEYQDTNHAQYSLIHELTRLRLGRRGIAPTRMPRTA